MDVVERLRSLRLKADSLRKIGERAGEFCRWYELLEVNTNVVLWPPNVQAPDRRVEGLCITCLAGVERISKSRGDRMLQAISRRQRIERRGLKNPFRWCNRHGLLHRKIASLNKPSDSLQKMESLYRAAYSLANQSPESEEIAEQLALREIVNGGMAGVLQAAGKVSAKDRANLVMNQMLDSPNAEEYFAWRIVDWVERLKMARKTILETDAYKIRIKSWQAQNRERVSKKTISRKTGD